MKRRVLSALTALTLLLTAFAGLIPYSAHAGARCPDCDEWNEDEYCPKCWRGSCCRTICDSCGFCTECMVEAGEHCPECEDACIGEDFGNVPHCEVCLKCEDCATLHETADGLKCEDCIEEAGDNDYNIMCPHCETNIIGSTYDEDDPMDDNLADCGVHCTECYEAFLCPECNECTLCEEVDICEHCEICENCAVDAGYHCGYCDEHSCYSEVGQCPDGGEHCVNCCEDVCIECHTCTLGAEIDYCEECHMCENCWGHCEICNDCFEDVPQCEEEGEHCRMCCMDMGWLCEQCERCTEALGLDFCEYCGLCEECCADNSAFYGLNTCLLNEEETDLEEVDLSKHDENHHILKYQSSSDECHDVWCIFPGCDYAVWDSFLHVYLWKTIEEPTFNKEGKEEGICLYCGDKVERAIPKLETSHYYFIEQPNDMEVLPSKDRANFYVHVGTDGSVEDMKKYLRVAVLPILEGETLPDSGKKPSRFPIYVYDDDVRLTSKGAQNFGLTYDPDNGLIPCSIPGHCPIFNMISLYDEYKFHDYTAQGKKLTWRLALHDSRGGDFIVWSDPFTIDWDAKHVKHTPVYVYGKLSAEYKYIWQDTKKNDTDYLKAYPGDYTYHWQVCSVCGIQLSLPTIHHFALTDKTAGNCADGGVWRYTCMDCGHIYEAPQDSSIYPHTWSNEYDYTIHKHWIYCVVCKTHKELPEYHKFETKTTTTCEGTTEYKSCTVCDYCTLTTTPGPGHQFTSDGAFNGWYADSTDHWRICKVCGTVEKAAHNYVGGACSVCGRDTPQMAIVGSPCIHGWELTIKLVDDITAADKAKFLAGQWSATWIDDDTGNTVGMGQTYPLDQGDEGHQFRAEVSIIGGEDYNAYMYSPIQTTYLNVQGYAATCALEGLMTHQVCQGCGRKFINGQGVTNVVIPKTNDHVYDNDCDKFCNVCAFEREAEHTWSMDYVFTDEGHSTKCTVCGFVTEYYPHDLNVTILKSAICGTDGLMHKECSLCAYQVDEVIPAPVHKMEYIEAVPATCVSQGAEAHYYCSGCDMHTTDAEGQNQIGIYHLLTPIDPNNHYGGDKLGYTPEEHYTICACGAHIEKGPHTFDEKDRCTVCHYQKGSKVKTGGKTLTKHDMVLPTCMATGTKAYYTDENGKMYLSPAGVVEVASTALVMPKSTVRHVGGPYGHSASEHWIDCACGAKLHTTAHKFDDNKVCKVCGYDANAPEPDEPGKAGNDTFPWWLWLVIGGSVLLIGGAVTLIILILSKKKKDEDKPKEEPKQNG